MAAPQGNQGGGMFARYQGEQVNQIPAGYVEAMGSMGRAYAQIGDTLGKTFQGMAAEKVKQDQVRSTAQGLLDSYTNGDPESAMYSDSTPNHVKQFLGRTFESGGIESMSQKDLNAFVAGEQAYNSKIDRDIKLRQIAATEAGVDNKGGTAGLERLGKALKAGADINAAISGDIRNVSAATVPPSAQFFTKEQSQITKEATNRAGAPFTQQVDALRQSYDQKRVEMAQSEKVADEADITDPEYSADIALADYSNSKKNAAVALQKYEEAQKKKRDAETAAGFTALSQSFTDPTIYSKAVSARQTAILDTIGRKKQSVREELSKTYGPEVAQAINITKEDEDFAEKAARDIPEGTVLTQGPGYAWVMQGGKFVFKTATQMGTGDSVVKLPPNLDYGKEYAGLSPNDFYALPANVQGKILDNVNKQVQALKGHVELIQGRGDVAAKTLTPEKFFGWSGYIANSTELRHVMNLTSGKKTMDWSIDQIISTYQKYGTNRAFSPEARAVFRALRPAMIAAVRPMVAGGNQQSDTELRTILASLPMGEDITSLKDYDIAQYRFMKVMFGRSYSNTLSSIPGLKYEQIGAADDYTGLPSKTKVLIDDFATGGGSFAGMSPEQRMKALQTELDTKDKAGTPYLDSAGQKILIQRYNPSAFSAETATKAIDNEEKQIKPEDKEKIETLRPGYNQFQNIEQTLGQ